MPGLLEPFADDRLGLLSDGTTDTDGLLEGLAPSRGWLGRSPGADPDPVQLAQMAPLFARPFLFRNWRVMPHPDEIGPGSAGGPGAYKPFPRSMEKPPPGTPCTFCKKPMKKVQNDHLHPRSRGGNNSEANRRPSCPECNRSKGDKLYPEWYEWVKRNFPALFGGYVEPSPDAEPPSDDEDPPPLIDTDPDSPIPPEYRIAPDGRLIA